MDPLLKKGILALAVIVLIIILYNYSNQCDCKSRISYKNINHHKGISFDSLYAPADSLELVTIKSAWESFDYKSDSFEITKTIDYKIDRQLLIIANYAEGRKHYSAVFLPKEYKPSQNYPLLLWANGLDQAHPQVELNNLFIKKVVDNLEHHFVLVPSYRGQALVAYNKRYCSDGFFGDAFDGATDDALRLLNLVQNEYAGVDLNHLQVCGVSRGGTVALLMAARQPQLKSVVSIAGPVDFFTKTIYYKYGAQYKYQFLSYEASMPELRKKMLKSSPIYFISNYSNNLLLVQGKMDEVVSVENAERVIQIMQGKENFEYLLTEEGHRFTKMNLVLDWLKKESE